MFRKQKSQKQLGSACEDDETNFAHSRTVTWKCHLGIGGHTVMKNHTRTTSMMDVDFNDIMMEWEIESRTNLIISYPYIYYHRCTYLPCYTLYYINLSPWFIRNRSGSFVQVVKGISPHQRDKKLGIGILLYKSSCESACNFKLVWMFERAWTWTLPLSAQISLPSQEAGTEFSLGLTCHLRKYRLNYRN